MTEVSSAAGTIAYQYDERGNLLSVTNHNGDVVSYTYDRYGNKISMTYPDGSTVSSAQGTVLCAQEKPMKG